MYGRKRLQVEEEEEEELGLGEKRKIWELKKKRKSWELGKKRKSWELGKKNLYYQGCGRAQGLPSPFLPLQARSAPPVPVGKLRSVQLEVC